MALRYAIEVTGGVDGVALTHLDVAERYPLLVCDGYDVGGQRMDRLPVSQDRDLDRQERMTRMLLRARPVCTEPATGWAAVVGRALGAPVSLLSSGPTALDKTLAKTTQARARKPAISRPGRPRAASRDSRREFRLRVGYRGYLALRPLGHDLMVRVLPCHATNVSSCSVLRRGYSGPLAIQAYADIRPGRGRHRGGQRGCAHAAGVSPQVRRPD